MREKHAGSRLRETYRSQLLTMLSGDPHGEPDWVKAMSEGDDEGLFGMSMEAFR